MKKMPEKKKKINKRPTKLSTQFAAFTTMLIAITVFCIALYSITTVNEAPCTQGTTININTNLNNIRRKRIYTILFS